MKFAKIVFWIAGIWGLLVVPPLFFIFDRIGKDNPPPITHPGFYYGFATVTLAWQIAFILIARDPVRLRHIWGLEGAVDMMDNLQKGLRLRHSYPPGHG